MLASYPFSEEQPIPVGWEEILIEVAAEILADPSFSRQEYSLSILFSMCMLREAAKLKASCYPGSKTNMLHAILFKLAYLKT